MKTIPLVLVLAAACAALPAARSAETSLKGRRYPAEHKIFTAEESGLEVIQLTTHAADDSGLYFTGNSFTDGGVVFTSRRTGQWNLFFMDLKTFEFVQLTDARSISGTGADVCAATREVFYREGQTIKAVNVRTLAERKITTVPDGYNPGAALSVTAAGDALAFSITEKVTLKTKTDVIYSDMDEHFAMRPWSAVLTGRTDGTGWHEVARQKKWISHTLISPTNPALIVYCHEGRWQQVEQRMWLVNGDGSANRALRPEETPELRIGHEYWFADGVHVGYQSQAPNGPKMIGVADARDGTFREYKAPFSDGHTNASHHGNLFVGDGSDKEPFVNLYELKNGALTGRHVFRHGSSFSQQHWHPHPAFSPDDKFVLFTSNRASAGDVYLIRTAR